MAVTLYKREQGISPSMTEAQTKELSVAGASGYNFDVLKARVNPIQLIASVFDLTVYMVYYSGGGLCIYGVRDK